jgi:glycosyltransferase involved in cell wall biosynthesis
MKIVAVQTGLEPDSVLGGNITDREFLTRLADRGVEIHVLAEEGFPILEHPGLAPHHWRRRTPRKLPYVSNFDVALSLRRLLKSLGGADWVRFNHPYAVGVGAALANDGARLWGSYLHCEDWALWKALDAWLPGRCDLVTCLSPDTRDDVVRRCPQSDHENNVVVPMGIDLARMDAVSTGRAALREELGVGPEEPLVLFAGVLIPRKGIAELAEAWRRLPPDPPARLLVIGKPVDPVESERITALAAADPRVRHLASVPYERIPDYYRAADIFFFPTRREGFGIVVGEAMAAGLPVVTTRARGVRGVVSEGETAMLADVGDAPALSAHLSTLIRDPALRRRLGAAGRRRIAERFSWEPIVDALWDRLTSARGLRR